MEHIRQRAVLLDVLRSAGTRDLVLCNLDWFMAYNDELGHVVGDVALESVGEAIESIDPRAMRFGGAAFVVLTDNGAAVAEEIRAAVERLDRPSPKLVSPARLTISAGVAPRPIDEDASEWLLQAEQALHRAKRAGRNRVAVADKNGFRVVDVDRPRVEIRADRRYS